MSCGFMCSSLPFLSNTFHFHSLDIFEQAFRGIAAAARAAVTKISITKCPFLNLSSFISRMNGHGYHTLEQMRVSRQPVRLYCMLSRTSENQCIPEKCAVVTWRRNCAYLM